MYHANMEGGTIKRAKLKINSTLTRISRMKITPSPTPHLLNSNYPPTEEEVPLILETISQAEIEGNRVSATLASKKIPTISTNLVKVHLDRVNENLLRHRAILSSIRRIPPEVLEEIFAFSISDCESGRLGSKSFQRSHLSIPQTQSQVCRLWRSVALSVPRFWSHIPTIYLDRPSSRKRQFLASLTDLLERRSGQVPISFHVVAHSKMTIYEPHPALALLVSHSTKWKTAILDMSWIKEEELFRIKGRIPLLENLILSFSSYHHDPPTLDIFQDAPELRKALVVGGGSTIFHLPHHQLVHYRDDCFATQCDDLSKLISLHTLEIGEYCVLEGGVVTLPNLAVLRVKMTSLNGEFNPLEIFILPALKELSISCILYGPLEANVMRPILALVLRSEQPSLMERLHVRSGLMEPGKLTTLLQYLPLLTHLNIDLPPVVDLTRLTSTTDILVPSLQVCTFYSVGMLDDEQARLCRQLALARCEVPDQHPTISDPTLHDFSVQCALHIELDFCTPSSQQRILHGWTESQTTTLLKAYRRSLINHLYKKVRPPDLPSLLSGDYYTSIIHSTLTLVHTTDVTRAEDLYMSGILRTLHHIINRYPSKTKDWKEAFCQKSEIILDQWNSLIETSIDHFHWGIDGRRIFHIPRNSPFRKSADTMTKVMTEQYRGSYIREIDPPWPLDDWK